MSELDYCDWCRRLQEDGWTILSSEKERGRDRVIVAKPDPVRGYVLSWFRDGEDFDRQMYGLVWLTAGEIRRLAELVQKQEV